MKLIKNLSFVAALATVTLFSSCSDEQAVPQSSQSDAVNYMNSFEQNIGGILNHDVRAMAPRKISQAGGGFNNFNDRTTVVFVDTQLADTMLTYDQINNVRSIGELMTFIHEYGLNFSLEDDGTFDTAIYLSEEEAKEALKPLLKACKEYLYQKGLYEFQIQRMLRDNDVDEASLIPFVIALVEYELMEEDVPIINPENPYSNNGIQKVPSMKQVIDCAADALIGYVIHELFVFSLNAITPKILITLFGKFVAKHISWIGAAIAVGEFSYCIYENW